MCLFWVHSTLALVYLGMCSGLGMRLAYSPESRGVYCAFPGSARSRCVSVLISTSTSVSVVSVGLNFNRQMRNEKKINQLTNARGHDIQELGNTGK